MQGLRPFAQQQDENALAHLHRGGLAAKAPLGGGEGGLGGWGKGTPLPFARKALGNITNRGCDAENAALPSKTPAAGAALARRVLGDLTNVAGGVRTGGLQPRAPAAEKPSCSVPAGDARAQPAVVPAPPAGPDRAELYAAAEGVERLAGKGWEQMERDRAAAEEAEAQRRRVALAALSKRSLPTFFPLWSASPLGVASSRDVMQKESLPSLPPSPVASSRSAGLPSMLDTCDLSLPEVAMGELDLGALLAADDCFY